MHFRAISAAALACSFAVAAARGDIKFTKIAETGEPVWADGASTFQRFGTPCIDGTTVAFAHQICPTSICMVEGIYKFVDGAGVLVARAGATAFPGGTGFFTNFKANLVIDGDCVAFAGYGDDNQCGIYTDPDGLVTIADTYTAVPGTNEPFTLLINPWIDGGKVVFQAESALGGGVYLYDAGVLSAIADHEATMPPDNEACFDVLMSPCTNNYKTAFTGRGASARGVYFNDGRALACAADTATAIPSGSGVFTDFGNFAGIDGNGNVVFNGNNSSTQRGIYLYNAATRSLEAVANRRSRLPGFNAYLWGFGSVSFAGDNIAFVAKSGQGSLGYDKDIYVRNNGSMIKLVGYDDVLDGKTVNTVQMGHHAVSGNRVAFSVEFQEDYHIAIYVAELSPGDLNGDGHVNIFDLAELLSNYGNPGTRAEGDINGDGLVNGTDFGILLGRYGN
jgi:hypothetical protein